MCCIVLVVVLVHRYGHTEAYRLLRSMVWQAVLLVAQLETQQTEWGVADKDTRALARQRQAKMKQAHQLVDQLALWEVLGTTQHPNQVRVTSSQLRSMFFHLLSDSQRCLEQLALLKLERARLNAWGGSAG
ncbi:hypothetical protein V8C86DRAFT_2551662, partial [Haematococcus lacustris]